MCGRTACTLAPDDIIKACSYRDRKGNRRSPQWRDAPSGKQYSPSFNMAPTAHCPVILSGSHFQKKISDEANVECDRVLMPMKWGLTPSWHKDDPYKVPFETNNCRMEGMLEKKTYKVPLQKGYRCVVVMDGFFEWNTSKSGKQPHFFYFPQSPEFSLDGKKRIKLQNASLVLKKEATASCNVSLNLNKEAGATSNHDKKEEESNAKTISCDANVNLKQEQSDQEFDATKTGHEQQHDKEELANRGVKNTLGNKRKFESFNESDVRDDDDDNENDDDDGDKPWSGPRLLTVAGVFDIWKSPTDGSSLYSYSIITVPASQEFSWCHHRMPALLTCDQEIDDWLNVSDVPLAQASHLIRPNLGLAHHPVTKAMGNSRYREPDCVMPVDVSKPKPSPSSNFMLNWMKGEKKSKV